MKTHIDIFARHLHLNTFVETGTCYGRSVEAALGLGFKDIRSIEAQPDRFEHCRKLFEDRGKRVKLWNGESIFWLRKVIADLQEPALFWLDAHTSGVGYSEVLKAEFPSYIDSKSQSEILKIELGIIKEHPVKDHVILIDDLTPDIQQFCVEQFPNRDLTVFSITEGPLKVLEIV